MKNVLRFSIIVFLLFFLGWTIPADSQKAGENAQEDIEDQISRAFEAGDTDRLTTLVKKNRYKVYSIIINLLNSGIEDELNGNLSLAGDKMAQAEGLATLYNEIFREDHLLKRAKLFQGWSRPQKEMKIEADSLKRTVLTDYHEAAYDKASEKLARTLRMYRELGDRWGEVSNLVMIGNNYWYQEEYQTALEYYTQSLTLNREIGHRKREGQLANNIGLVHWNLGQYDKALEYYEKALAIHRETGYRAGEGMTLSNMGDIHENLGQYQRALECLEQSLSIRRETGNKRSEGIVLGNISNIYKKLSQYQEALDYLGQALNINRETGNKRSEGLNLTDIGDVYVILGQYRRALEYLGHAYDVFKEIDYKKGQGMSLTNIGLVHWHLGHCETALGCYENALDISKEIEYRRGEGIALAHIGDIYYERGRYQKAFEHYQHALSLFRELGNREDEGASCCRIGDAYCGLGEFQEALERHRKALRIATEIDAPEITWAAQSGIGHALEGQGQVDEALEYYQQAVATIESIREQLDIESLKTHFLAGRIGAYDSIVRLLAEKGRNEEALEYAERAKARALLDVLSQGGFHVTEGVDDELLTKEEGLKRKLNLINTQLAQEYARKEEIRDLKRISSLKDSLQRARTAAEELAREIELAHPSYAELTGISKPLTLGEIQQKVLSGRDHSVLVEYLVGEENTHVWAVRQNSLDYESIQIRKEELEDMIRELRQPFVDFREGEIYLVTNLPYDVGLAHKLYQLIFQPIEAYLSEADHVIIIPDGILHNLPFGALVTEIEEKEMDIQTTFSQYENARYVIERYAICYAPSASILNPDLRRPVEEDEVKGELLAFGNPDFGRVAREKEEDMGVDITPIALLLRSGEEWVFEQLPMAEGEVNEISDVMGTLGSAVYTGAEAKEELFKEEAKGYRHIHLATHSVLEDKEPLYSRIVFALDDDPEEDGFLEAHEIFNLRLNADVVVLSACETGLGELSAGEGLIGLTRAFMYAGAPSVVVSLWSVDESTCRLMKAFYQNLKDGITKAEALRQAKVELIHTRDGGISYAHPFLWAPFVLVGEWR